MKFGEIYVAAWRYFGWLWESRARNTHKKFDKSTYHTTNCNKYIQQALEISVKLQLWCAKNISKQMSDKAGQ